jgi:ubiquinone/menaquinone biosynthesis C-methylase UbiE
MDRLLELTHLAEQSHFWFRGFRWFVQPEVLKALAGVSAPVIIDCGCGTGSNIAWLQQYGRACGFDLTWNGLALGRSMGRTQMARASIAAIPFPDRCADLATSFDVFQCLPAPIEREAIAEMWRVLKPGGQIVLNVAALDVLRGAHATLSEEVRRYTPGRLRQIVESVGFEIERMTFVNASLFPLMLPVRVMQRWRGGDAVPAGEFDIQVPAAPLNAVLSGMVWLEAAALRGVNMPIGGSILCRARKPAA